MGIQKLSSDSGKKRTPRFRGETHQPRSCLCLLPSRGRRDMGRAMRREQQTESHWPICPRRREGKGWFGRGYRRGSASWAGEGSSGGGGRGRLRGGVGSGCPRRVGLLAGPCGPAAASAPFPGRRVLEPGAEEAGGEDVASVGDLGGHGTAIWGRSLQLSSWHSKTQRDRSTMGGNLFPFTFLGGKRAVPSQCREETSLL